jgi:hypothetical protein
MDMEDKELARLMALVRIAAGAGLFLTPRLAARSWTGERTESTTADLAVRGMGARDVALGAGLLIALERGAPVRGWLEAGAFSDAADAAGTLLNWRSMSNLRSLLWFATEVSAAYFGSRLAQALD